MASRCISSCAEEARAPVRATYVNLYRWPQSDFEFVRSMSSNSRNSRHPRVVDSISCRQLYLRSYTFSREEDHKQEKKTSINCLGRDREKPDNHGRKRKNCGAHKKSAGLNKAKSVSCSALAYIFRRLLSCTTEIDVAN